MHIKTTTIPGLTFAVQIEEVNHLDPVGGLICYLASLYIKDGSARRLVRRSRIPGAAEEMCREFQRDGIREFQRDGIRAFRRLERA